MLGVTSIGLGICRRRDRKAVEQLWNLVEVGTEGQGICVRRVEIVNVAWRDLSSGTQKVLGRKHVG